MSALSNAIRIAPLAATLACSPGPIVWEDSTLIGGRMPRTWLVVEPGGRSYIDSSRLRPPALPGQCTASVQVWLDESGVGYAAWWSLRADSTADLVASSTSDGRSWTSPVRLDTLDVGRVGCNRPPPGVFANGDSFYVVYFMHAKESPGFFLSHSMDRARTFHSPVAVVYGEKPGLAAVTANGNFVVVAFEDPNTNPTRISIAVSTTMAHLFEFRSVISPKDAAASQPEVMMAGQHVLLRWHRAGSDSAQRIEVRGIAPGANK